LALSLATFSSNFFFQKAVFVLGKLVEHFGHLCQKHPFTKIAIRLPGKQMSGLPGAFLQLMR
jgi:hypothetical protein